MTDLIRREDVKKFVCANCVCKHLDEPCDGDCAMLRNIDHMPSADAVEVVRCAECIHASEHPQYTNAAIRMLKASPQCPMYDYYNHLVIASGYCQAGIRRKSTDGGEEDE